MSVVDSQNKFYHVLVMRDVNEPSRPRFKYEENLTKDQVIQKFLVRYLSKKDVICSGSIFENSEIKRIKVYQTNSPIEFTLSDGDIERDKIVTNQGKEVTRALFDLSESLIEEGKKLSPTIEALTWLEMMASRFRTMCVLLEKRPRGRPPFAVQDEYDFQDLVHCILTIQFNDVRKEEVTPEYAGASTRIDFLLPEVSVTVENKFATEKHGRKEIGEEIIIDITKYKEHPKCDALACLIYDPKFLIKNKFGFIADLEKLTDKNLIVKVFIIQ